MALIQYNDSSTQYNASDRAYKGILVILFPRNLRRITLLIRDKK